MKVPVPRGRGAVPYVHSTVQRVPQGLEGERFHALGGAGGAGGFALVAARVAVAVAAPVSVAAAVAVPVVALDLGCPVGRPGGVHQVVGHRWLTQCNDRDRDRGRGRCRGRPAACLA